MTSNQIPVAGPGDLLRLRQAALAEELVERQYAAQPELALRYGPAGREKCLRDANYHLAYLADAMNAGDAALFANYVAWARVMLGKRGIPAADLARNLELTRLVVARGLDGAAGALAEQYLDLCLAGLASLPGDLPTCLPLEAPHAELARAYLHSLLGGERQIASRLILDAVAAGVTVREIYLNVFQSALYEVGRLWQVNEISVAQEHYCTAATQLIMSQLYPHIFASEKRGGAMVGTCVAGDLHEIGMRMVTDFFELDGWNTYYLGASMPPRAVTDMVVQRRAAVLGISATMSFHLPAVAELIQMVRAQPECGGVKILTGGYPFLVSPGLWRTMGADGSAPNAREAVLLADRLVAGGDPL